MTNNKTVTMSRELELFESILALKPEAYLHESVYQVTESEVLEFARQLAAPVVEPATCAQCKASTADICNQNGCGYLESGNGAPVVERQSTGQWRISVNGDWFYGTKEQCIRERSEYESTFSALDHEEAGAVLPEQIWSSPPAPVAVVLSHKEDLAHDVGYRNGVMHGYKLATEGSEDDYQNCVNRLTKEINEGRREIKSTPASVVMPDREWGSSYADGWNACLDKVKEMNR